LNTRPQFRLERMIAEMQDLPISSDEPTILLESLWEALFPGEGHHLSSLAGYKEDSDQNLGNEIFAPDGGWPDRG
jgi:hypothetical protein